MSTSYAEAMAKRPFERGSLVTVCMTRNDCLPFQTAPKFDAVLVRNPQGEGDDYQFRLPSGDEFRLNPLCVEFIGLVWRKERA